MSTVWKGFDSVVSRFSLEDPKSQKGTPYFTRNLKRVGQYHIGLSGWIWRGVSFVSPLVVPI